MNETLTQSVWEDLIHNQRWEELRAKLAATHSSDIAEALGQIHGMEQAVVSAFCPATPMLMRYSSRIDANVGITGTELRLAVVFGGCFLTFPERIIGIPAAAIERP